MNSIEKSKVHLFGHWIKKMTGSKYGFYLSINIPNKNN